MSAEILTLRGAPLELPKPEEPFVPDPLVLEIAERLLAQAKSGEIVGFACVKLAPNGAYSTGWDFQANAFSISLTAGAHALAFRLTRLDAGDE